MCNWDWSFILEEDIDWGFGLYGRQRLQTAPQRARALQ
jgi:hypothetical protein